MFVSMYYAPNMVYFLFIFFSLTVVIHMHRTYFIPSLVIHVRAEEHSKSREKGFHFLVWARKLHPVFVTKDTPSPVKVLVMTM